MRNDHSGAPGLSPEEKARITRIFRRRAVLTDICLVLALACGAFALAGVFLTYGCCPVCGRRPHKWDWAWTPILWRFFRCPECGFTPRRDGKRGGEPEA